MWWDLHPSSIFRSRQRAFSLHPTKANRSITSFNSIFYVGTFIRQLNFKEMDVYWTFMGNMLLNNTIIYSSGINVCLSSLWRSFSTYLALSSTTVISQHDYCTTFFSLFLTRLIPSRKKTNQSTGKCFEQRACSCVCTVY